MPWLTLLLTLRKLEKERWNPATAHKSRISRASRKTAKGGKMMTSHICRLDFKQIIKMTELKSELNPSCREV
jgi:hypothetical protein